MLEKVKLGGVEIETNCPHYSIQVSPGDFGPGDELKFECEERRLGTENCTECLLSNVAAILMHIRDIEYTVLRELQQQRNLGGLSIPTINTRK